jgi:chromate reductase, NAD(P)H dehydrogenase (quinone)
MALVVGIAGSLREGSLNAALLGAAVELAPEGMQIDIRSIRGVPLYDGDLEKAEGVPAAVEALKDAVAAADGLILATPEYNNGIPGVFKNAVDWMSRPPADIGRVFGGRKVMLMGASPGGFGTILAQAAWLPVLRTLGCEVFPGKVIVSRAGQAIVGGRLVSEETRDLVAKRLGEFAAFLGR